MTSAIDIANRALSEAAARSSIASFTEDSPEAQAANQFYQTVADQVTCAARWGFTRRTALLSLLKVGPAAPEFVGTYSGVWSAAYPPPNWLYSYALPSDCLAFWRVQPSSNATSTAGVPIFSVTSLAPLVDDYRRMPSRFERATDIDGNGNPQTVILTNETQALGEYAMRISDPGMWDALFTEAVVQALAGKLAIAISGDKGLAQLKYKTANEAIINARIIDANAGVTVDSHNPDWITARGGMAYGALPGRVWGDYGPLFV